MSPDRDVFWSLLLIHGYAWVTPAPWYLDAVMVVAFAVIAIVVTGGPLLTDDGV